MQKIKCKVIFSEEEQQEIIRLYLLPESLSSIAKKFGLKNRGVIKRVLIENNIALRTQDEINNLGQKKVKQTMQEKYGCDNAFQVKQFKEKAKKTKLDKYGDENYRNKEQIIKTCLERYDTTNGGWTVEAQEKIRTTNIAKFGVDCYFKTKQHKIAASDLMQNTDFRLKLYDGMKNKFGVEHFAQAELFHKVSQKSINIMK